MCRYCPPGSIVCLEPTDEPAPRCAFCTEEPAAEDVFATAAMAAHVVGVVEHDPLCAGCARDIREDLAAMAAEEHDPSEGCGCDRCVEARAELDVVCDERREGWIAAVELCLPWELGFDPARHSLFAANDVRDSGEAA